MFFGPWKFPNFHQKLTDFSKFKLAMNKHLWGSQFYIPLHQPGPLVYELVHFHERNSQNHFLREFIKIKTQYLDLLNSKQRKALTIKIPALSVFAYIVEEGDKFKIYHFSLFSHWPPGSDSLT